MQIYTIVNRTNRVLHARWAGKFYDAPPGPSAHPQIIAMALKYQNPIKGSDNQETGCLEYLVGIKEEGDPTDPVDPSREKEIELYSRRGNPVQIQIVPGNVGMYAVRDVHNALSAGGGVVDSGFTKA